jgi:hypothetical protein
MDAAQGSTLRHRSKQYLSSKTLQDQLKLKQIPAE